MNRSRTALSLIAAAAVWASAGAPAARTARAAQTAGLHEAARAGDTIRLKALLKEDPASLESRDGKGMTPLHAACRAKKPAAVGVLLAAGADVKAVDADKETPLHTAAFVGDAESCRLLLKAGADPKALESQGRTPLMLACGFGQSLDAVRRLVEGGSDINAVAPSGENVLLGTLYYGKPEIIDFLIASGARLAEDDRSVAVGLMVSSRRALDAVFRQAWRTAESKSLPLARMISMHEAAAGGSTAVGEALLGKGFPADEVNRYGSTPLHVAAEQGRTGFVRLLLDRGARIDAADRMGRTAWNLARDGGHGETADLLRSRGASGAEARFPELRGPWMGQPEPGDKPEIFAPGIVSGFAFDSEHSPVAFSPNGEEAYWTRKFRGPILFSSRVDGLWTAPKPAPFVSPWGDGEPVFSPDGRRIYFLSFRPLQPGGPSDKENIWYVEREGGGWSAPRPEAPVVNAYDHHWLFSVAADGTLCFSAAQAGGMGGRDIYFAKQVDGVRQAPVNAGPVINGPGEEHTPFLAPDGSYLLFVSQGRPESRGQFRFFISYRRGDGWTEPVGLGEPINRMDMALCPMVTPDGRFMTFLGQGDIYWVAAGFIEALRPKM